MNLPEHNKTPAGLYPNQYGYSSTYRSATCTPDCPRCLIDKALAEQKAEMIADVKQKRAYYEGEICRLVEGEMYAKNTVEKFKAKVAMCNELLKGWKEG